MKNKNSISPKTKTQVRLRKIAIISGSALLIGGIIWKVVLGTAAVVKSTDSLAAYTPASGPQISGFSWSKLITVDHAQVLDTMDLVDFPLYVELEMNELKSVSNGGNVENTDGYDIVFSGDNDHQLDHQIEEYDPATGRLIAWVRLPILFHDVDTELKISCGNAGNTSSQSTENVWGQDYTAVWHMSNNPQNCEQDDAAGTYNAPAYGSMNSNDLVTGKLGDAIDFDGSNDYMPIKNKSFTDPGEIQEITVSAWVNTTYNSNSTNSNWSIVDFDRSKYFNFFVHGLGKIAFCTKGQTSGTHYFYAGSNGQINDGEWHYVVGVYDGVNKSLYIDGSLISIAANPHGGHNLGNGTDRFGIIGDGSKAATYNGSRNGIYYRGKLDEIRMLNVARSSGWIATEFNNQNSPNTFYSIGDPTNLPIELVSFTGDLEDGKVTLTWDVATQRDNDYFTIERSNDGNNFSEVGEVDGAGTTLDFKTYTLIDDKPLDGLSYYRLKQTDFNGAFETFIPLSIHNEISLDQVTLSKAYPNPFQDYISIDFQLNHNSELEIQLLDLSGRTLFSESYSGYAGDNTYKYNVSDPIPPGTYILALVQNGSILAQTKVVKQ